MDDGDYFLGKPVTRRRFGGLAGGTLASALLACRGSAARLSSDGRLAARPRNGGTTTASGTRPLGIGGERGAFLQVPSKAPAAPLPLLVLLHGASGAGSGILRRIGPLADELGIAVLAPDSRESTWDAIHGEFGPDVDFIDRALGHVFDRVAVDPARIAVGGFSDGATYALSLGLINGDLFRRVLAFSPGFVVERGKQGKPRFFISHGTADPVLPIDRCSRRLVTALQKGGYDVTFREFSGGHTVPPEIAREGLAWVAA